jgi:hypothetical protein
MTFGTHKEYPALQAADLVCNTSEAAANASGSLINVYASTVPRT